MKALQSLTDLFNAHIIDPKSFDSWAENGAIFCSQGELVDGFEVEYTAMMFVQDAKLHPETLFMHIVCWLNKHDPHRAEKGLPMPTFAVEPLDGGRFDFKLSIDMQETFNLVNDEQGDWLQAGERYRCDNEFEVLTKESEHDTLLYFVAQGAHE
ncbi:phage tail protein [uncultured Vibrio sp.]|uniref:phage tail protein n=1 Tax=uncultured Vibrio sp. TaxID=114054 RepID=UPI002639017D|nr:phage tail protein [uncultured Vibrio sp.]